jgi:hypothetical protein
MVKLIDGPRRTTLAILIAALCAPSATAAEIVVRNDSIPPGTPLPTFLPGERVASWLTAPVTGKIVGVQILWGSQFNANPSQLEMAITVSAGGAFPTPGAPLATIVAPTLADGIINEFRFLDPPTDLIPLMVPVAAGQTFVIDLEFFNQSSGNPMASSIEIDNDGIQPGKNSVFVLPGGWMDAGPLGVTGDWGIRAIIVPEPISAVILGIGLVVLFAVRWPIARGRGISLVGEH